MKISGSGAAVGALVGGVGRAAVVLISVGVVGYHGPVAGALAVLAMASGVIGLLVGAIAGATGKPLLGAVVGALLSGAVFEMFMCACASLLGSLSQRAGADFFQETLVYGLQMAIAGALAGGIGGWVGSMNDRRPDNESHPPQEDASA
jgi:hypothetical protein